MLSKHLNGKLQHGGCRQCPVWVTLPFIITRNDWDIIESRFLKDHLAWGIAPRPDHYIGLIRFWMSPAVIMPSESGCLLWLEPFCCTLALLANMSQTDVTAGTLNSSEIVTIFFPRLFQPCLKPALARPAFECVIFKRLSQRDSVIESAS